MSKVWPNVPLGNVLKRAERFEPREELTEYAFAGTYSFARGVFRSERKLGSAFALPRIQRVHEGDFVYCKIMAWEGAFGLVTRETDDCVMSGAFVVYELNRERIEPKFLESFFKIPGNWKQIGRHSNGTNVRRQSLHPNQFESSPIPLPPLAEQRRIVMRIEALINRIDEADELQRGVNLEADALCRSIIFKSNSDSKLTQMRELVSPRKPDVVVRGDEMYHFAGVYCFGGGVFKGRSKSGLEFAYPCLTRLQAGNFVYPKLMAWEGALGIVPPSCHGLVVSPEFPVFEVNENRVLSEVLDVYFRTPSVWPVLAGASTGTNIRRRRLNPKDFLKYEMPLPPMLVQKKLRQVKQKVDALKKLQAENASQLNVLFPSILDKAFKGEL